MFTIIMYLTAYITILILPIPAYVCGNNINLGYHSTVYLTSPRYPNQYYDGINCYSTVTAPQTGDSILLHFEAFRTESCCDALYIIGSSNWVYSGPRTPPPYRSTGTVTLRFKTDGSVTDSGFNIAIRIRKWRSKWEMRHDGFITLFSSNSPIFRRYTLWTQHLLDLEIYRVMRKKYDTRGIQWVCLSLCSKIQQRFQ